MPSSGSSLHLRAAGDAGRQPQVAAAPAHHLDDESPVRRAGGVLDLVDRLHDVVQRGVRADESFRCPAGCCRSSPARRSSGCAAREYRVALPPLTGPPVIRVESSHRNQPADVSTPEDRLDDSGRSSASTSWRTPPVPPPSSPDPPCTSIQLKSSTAPCAARRTRRGCRLRLAPHSSSSAAPNGRSYHAGVSVPVRMTRTFLSDFLLRRRTRSTPERLGLPL